MEAFAELLKALAALLWPLIALYVTYVVAPVLRKLFEARAVKLKIGDYELTLGEATANIGVAITDIQAQLAALSEKAALPEKTGLPPVKSFSTSAAAGAPANMVETAGDPAPHMARILWVDDFPSNNAFLIERLRADGHLVDLALSTDDAMQRLSTGKYNGVISDLGRKETGVENPMAGRDLIAGMRRAGHGQPVLIFAGSRARALRAELLDAGAADVTSSGTDVIRFVDACAAVRPS